MDRSLFLKRMLLRLLWSPWVSVPAGLGASSLALGFLSGEPVGFFGFLGISGLLLSVGSAATYLLLAPERLAEQTFADLHHETEQDHRAFVDQLEQRLRAADDPRTLQVLAELRRLYPRLQAKIDMQTQAGAKLLPELQENGRRLYRSCLASLERSLVLWQASQEMSTKEMRERVLRSREDLLAELRKGVDGLAATLDGLYAASLVREKPDEELARIRSELETGLEVAQRVDERMEQLERSLTRRESPTRGV